MSDNDLQPVKHDVSDQVYACTILIVDDEMINRTLIERYLKNSGFHNTVQAANGREALDVLARQRVDLMVLDIMMPEMDGFEVLEHLRGSKEWQGLPVLVQTAMDDPQQRTRVFEFGANDLVTKPLNGAELSARVRVHLQNTLMIQELQNFHVRLSEELDLAREMQNDLLPSQKVTETCETACDVRLESTYLPSSEVGGDLWSLIPMTNRRMLLFMADLSGHGVSAAINAFRLHGLVGEMQDVNLAPGNILETLNERLKDILGQGQFASAFAAIYDANAQTLSFSGSSWQSPVIINADKTTSLLDTSGIPLGLIGGRTYESQTIDFPSGARLLSYSDGLVERPGLGRDMIGADGLVEHIEQIDFPEDDGLEALLSSLQIDESAERDDDILAVCLRAL